MLESCVFTGRKWMTLLESYYAVKKITGLEIKSWVLIPSLPLNYFVTQDKFFYSFFGFKI